MAGKASGRAAAAGRVGRYRWGIVGLLFAATVINYIDRQMIGVLKPTLSAELGWTETDFATVIFWFQAAYALGYIGFGRIVDLVGRGSAMPRPSSCGRSRIWRMAASIR